MTGNNKLILNTATMMEILQYWIDTKGGALMAPVFVVRVTASDNENTFVVDLSDTKRTP